MWTLKETIVAHVEAEFSYMSPSAVNEIFRLIDEEERKTKENKEKELREKEENKQKELKRQMIASGEAAESVATSNLKLSLKKTEERSKKRPVQRRLYGDARKVDSRNSKSRRNNERSIRRHDGVSRRENSEGSRRANRKRCCDVEVGVGKTQQRPKNDLFEMSILLEYELLEVVDLEKKKMEEEKQGLAPMPSSMEEAIIKGIEKYEEAELYQNQYISANRRTGGCWSWIY